MTAAFGLKALIFDVDGTLAETEEVHRAAFNAAFAAARLDWNWDRGLYRDLLKVTGGKERMSHYADAYRGGETLAAERVASLHRDKTGHYTRMVAEGGLSLRPGIERIIGEAREAGLPVAIATTTSAENVEALLAATLGADSPGWFAAIGAGDVVPAKKPAPDIYHWVLERLGIAPGDALAFEDSPNGVAASLGAGIPTIVTPGLYTEPSDFAGALKVVPDLGMVGLADLRHWHAP